MRTVWSRMGILLLLVGILLGPIAEPLRAQGDGNSDEALRERVVNSIERAQRFIASQQSSDGSWATSIHGPYQVGVTSLATLALLNSGLDARDPTVAKALSYLRGIQDPKKTYELSMMIMALAAAGDGRDKGRIARLAAKLQSYQHREGQGASGAWGYEGERGWWDNSNSQFALLALREAAYLGVPVDRDVWKRAQDHFLRTQLGSLQNRAGAGWGYQAGGSAFGSMTVAGVASLTITSSMLREDDDEANENGQLICCGEEFNKAELAIEAGVRWLSRHFRVSSNPGSGNWLLYYLYGLERAGRFTGRRFFGDHDWYREGADFLVRGQNPRDGSFRSENEREEVIGTSLALLFLSKGLSPVLINKLRWGVRDPSGDVLSEDWNQHPRDATNLVDFLSGRPKWPKLMTWQVLDLRAAANGEGVAALLQAPVQLLTGTESLSALQGQEIELLREYISQGGFLFAVQNCESAEFDEGIRDLVRRLFDGQYELRKLADTHDVYRSEYVFAENPPELWGVDFGCRTAIIYAPFDHACRWDRWMKFDPPGRHPQVKTQIGKSIQLGVNVIAYATGREVRDKLRRPDVIEFDESNRITRGQLTIARLRHTGGWDTAPNALRRLQQELKAVGIEPAAKSPNLAANDPALFDYPLVYVHGRKNFQLSQEEREKLRQYLENGGLLFGDACCGAAQFDQSFRRLVEQVFGRPLERIPSSHELFNLELGYDIRQVRRRVPPSNRAGTVLVAEETLGEPVLEGLEIDGRYAVIYSKYDLSCALERQASTACAGYVATDAAKIAVNIVLYGLFQ